jgi:hypothetical protein
MAKSARFPAVTVWRAVACVSCLALAGCATQKPPPAPPPPTPPTLQSLPPTVTRGEFTIHAIPLDVWNAIGDIVVRTPQASYDSRSQMLGLYSVRYKDQPLLILAHGLLLSDTVHELTTQVTAKSTVGTPVDSDAVAELLTLLQQQLPAEIEQVHARQLAEDVAAAAAAKKAKAHKKKSRRKK